MEHIIEVPGELIAAAIIKRAAAVAATTGRHCDWLSRRLRDAIDFVSSHPPSDKDFLIYWEIAEPVFIEAALLAGRKITDFKIGVVH